VWAASHCHAVNDPFNEGYSEYANALKFGDCISTDQAEFHAKSEATLDIQS